MASRAAAPSSRAGNSRPTVRGGAAAARLAQARAAARALALRALAVAAGAALVLLAMALLAALFTYSPLDPSWNTATARVPGNAMGTMGAWMADALLQLLGWPALALAPALASAGVMVARGRPVPMPRMVLGTLAGVIALAMAAGAMGLASAGAPAGAGGVAGMITASAVDILATQAALADLPLGLALGILLAPTGLFLVALGLGLGLAEWLGLARQAATLVPRRAEDAETPLPPRNEPLVRRPPAADGTEEAPSRPVVVEPAAAPPPAPRKPRADKQSALDLGDAANLPGLDLLQPPPAAPARRIDAASLEQNARLLEGVLEDFGVRGRIGEVRPGPVVTMYELEPAPGIKASRVIGLADDIARSMSALSARVAVVPGKNVIGIELPNTTREMVSLSELLGSAAFENRNVTLPLVLGKDIAGEPVVADLAPMPHLLIAGTTGSGKSVGLNAMILSLLYRLTPAQCRLIMIDPKMLELKMYDGIPHLLAPVVVDPPKAIRALKWAVEEMESRYRKMSELNVRSLASFNQKVVEAKKAGQPFVRRVQTGWDDETEMPIIEEEVLDFEPMPLIVVVVDELADLMMTAGKEVEYLIQRLAQKARAAGIHLIMATQRPSVDVITGVIKANLPTRISFQVTSKIDSRTILGEQGAEQLLGKGDMLWMAGGKLARVHGPFVSDDEVEAVADHWRRQGQPAYVDAVTEEPGDIDGQLDLASAGLSGGGAADDEDDIYTKAIMVVAKAQKASTSYIQRQMRVGYNSAARLIERMEEDGFVSRPDHVGRREVLIDENGNRR
jgi:S-DNA-T family DNA segregation ATPase FtsK/SpoIIIE